MASLLSEGVLCGERAKDTLMWYLVLVCSTLQ